MFVSILYTNSVRNISHSKEKLREILLKKCKSLHVKYPLLLSDINATSISQIDFLKILKFQIPWRLVPWEPSSSMRTDGQT